MPILNKISDERLLAKNLRNIRIAFVIQTLGIIVVLVNEWIKNGSRAMFAEPLHLVCWLASPFMWRSRFL